MKNNPFDPGCEAPREYNTYQTGSTTPPKAHRGLVAILLVLVVFLSGMVSILSFLNIRMFSTFYQSQQEEVPLSLEISDAPVEDAMAPDADPVTSGDHKTIGIQCDPITPVYREHFRLPEGLFITYVDEQSSAYREGIREGDVLISLEDVPIREEDSLKAFLETRSPGENCRALIYRLDTDEKLTFTLQIEQIKP